VIWLDEAILSDRLKRRGATVVYRWKRYRPDAAADMEQRVKAIAPQLP
jgi:hypothetical protein